MYRKFAIATIIAVYFLILVGGIVRASGSGMGCPDWPKCFGSWVPPTSVAQLPLNYQELYGAELKGEVEFNVFKTWTEYLNRLVGVLIGFLIFITMIFAIKTYWKSFPLISWVAILAFVLVAFEGWLGSKVVSTELHPGMVTIHMILAIGIVLLLIYGLFLSEGDGVEDYSVDEGGKLLLKLGLVLSLGQLILGTQVREGIDESYLSGKMRHEWINNLGGEYYLHIGLAVLIVLVNYFIFRSLNRNRQLRIYSFSLLLVVLIEFVAGGVLGLLGMPPVIQPVHLTLATIIIGVQFYILMKIRFSAYVTE